MHRPGRIGRDKFDHHLFALAVIGAAVGIPLGKHPGHNVGKPPFRNKKVDEAGTGGLGPFEMTSLKVQVADNRVGNRAGRAPEGARRRHRGVGRKIPVGGVGGLLDQKGGQRLLGGGKRAVRDRRVHRRAEDGLKLLACLADGSVFHLFALSCIDSGFCPAEGTAGQRPFIHCGGSDLPTSTLIIT